ncbi:ATP-binding cassette domain-containing protein [Arthrobacter sp. ATA002]|uniref:ATP-binding cassette domain-containing protein n=1 Tax=Arthrobacter sp. ATA002 TaxID=2991715 RepID=UPI002E3724C3|nr:ATP-binding cassette domain-containing protein [Arthrobacter sp. ATA002]
MPDELSAANVGFSYGGRTVLRNVTLSIPAGSQVGLTGPSGSGKTTLARVLAGLVAPSTGFVTCNGEAVRAAGDGGIAMLFQSPRRSCSPRMTLRAVIRRESGTPAVLPAVLHGAGMWTRRSRTSRAGSS